MAKGTVSLGLVGALKVSVRPLPGFSATWPQSADVGLGRTPEGLGTRIRWFDWGRLSRAGLGQRPRFWVVHRFSPVGLACGAICMARGSIHM
jgi:hypothetical protein